MSRPWTGALLVVAGTLSIALASCGQNMEDQPRYDPYGEAKLFADGKVMQLPAPGTVARDDPVWTQPYRERPPLTPALLQRGRERYAIFCAPCHGYSGDGNGTVPSRGFPHPPSFHSERLRNAASRHFFDVITDGYGVMFSYAARVSPADRWSIAAYIRALQISQGADAKGLPVEDREKLDKAARRGGSARARDEAG